MIFVLVLMLAVVAAAELVRMACRRQLTSPLAVKSTPDSSPAEVQALPTALGDRVAA